MASLPGKSGSIYKHWQYAESAASIIFVGQSSGKGSLNYWSSGRIMRQSSISLVIRHPQLKKKHADAADMFLSVLKFAILIFSVANFALCTI